MDWIDPMEPVLIDSIMKGGQWIHQVKWDGIRGLCYIEHNNIHLYTKSGRERSIWYPEITKEINLKNCRQAVLDGEMIVLDDEGKPSFYNVISRERIKRQDRLKQYLEKYPVQYMVFDILYKDGNDLRKLPLSERKEILKATLESEGLIQVVSDYIDGEALFLLMKEKNMEGIVSKKVDSPYIGGKKHRMWFKTKITKQLHAIVCGVKIKNNEVKSLVIGEFQNGSIIPLGSVSSGLSHKDRAALLEALPQLMEDEPPFNEIEKTNNVIWIKPVLHVLISYLEREQNGSLRHPVLVGFTN